MKFSPVIVVALAVSCAAQARPVTAQPSSAPPPLGSTRVGPDQKSSVQFLSEAGPALFSKAADQKIKREMAQNKAKAELLERRLRQQEVAERQRELRQTRLESKMAVTQAANAARARAERQIAEEGKIVAAKQKVCYSLLDALSKLKKNTPAYNKKLKELRVASLRWCEALTRYSTAVKKAYPSPAGPTKARTPAEY